MYNFIFMAQKGVAQLPRRYIPKPDGVIRTAAGQQRALWMKGQHTDHLFMTIQTADRSDLLRRKRTVIRLIRRYIPQEKGAILATAGQQPTIGRKGERV